MIDVWSYVRERSKIFSRKFGVQPGVTNEQWCQRRKSRGMHCDSNKKNHEALQCDTLKGVVASLLHALRRTCAGYNLNDRNSHASQLAYPRLSYDTFT